MQNSERVEAVQRMQDHIEQNIHNPITLYELSGCAGYSPYHSVRIFRELTGKTPFDYIRALRLSRAALDLRDENPRIVDVALDFVFDTHEGFTRAFSKEFGLTPSRYRKNPSPICLFMPYSSRARYHYHQRGEQSMENKAKTNTVFVQVIERPERKVIMKRGKKAEDYFAYCEEVGCDIWGLLCSVKEALYEPIGMWLADRFRTPGTSYYAQGVEVPVDYKGELPEGLEIMDLSPCKMMVFQGAPFKEENFEEAITELWEVMKTFDPSLYGYEWADDDGPRFQLAPEGYRGYIEARPVRPINK
ncbi:MAG TPA: AraC family transcriptional regulator [Clostridiales bacterium]|nr:AraC family transcriptional regulator [Clostridiales bacterium]